MLQYHQTQQSLSLHGQYPAQNLGSGLMSNSGQPAEEITTVFIVGFPDDMTEREFANMFVFARGFEASTLKIPAGGMLGVGTASQREASSQGGPGGPYSAVSMGGGNGFDSSAPWEDPSYNAGLARANSGGDPFSMGLLSNSLGSSSGA